MTNESQNRVRDALRPFVSHYQPWMDDWADADLCGSFARVTFGQLREARAVLAALTAPPASDAAGAEGERLLMQALYSSSELVGEIAAPTAPAQAPSRPVDAGGVEDEAGFLHTAETSVAWRDSAMQFSRNEDFYRGLVVQIGEMFGDAAKTSDDGSVQQDVLALKVPELVAAALATQPTGTEASRPVVPTGWKLVPEEPTEEMQAAGWIDKEDVSPKEIYWAMLAATPTPPQADSTGQGEATRETPKTDREIVEEVNRLAAFMLAIQGTGYTAPEGFKFYEADEKQIRARRAWQHAVEAYELITASEVHDALLSLEEDATPSQADAQTQEGGR